MLVRNGKVGFVIARWTGLFVLQIDQGMVWSWSLAWNVYEHVYLLSGHTAAHPIHMATQGRKCRSLMRSAVAYTSEFRVRWRFQDCQRQHRYKIKTDIKLKLKRCQRT